jgi:hypothetical protein
MDSEDVKLLISEFISLRDELTCLGGAEQAPVLWGRCVELRSIILKHFALSETTENIKLLDLPQMPETESYGISLAGLSDKQRQIDFKQLGDMLEQAGIESATEDQILAHKKRRIVNRIHQKLYIKALYLHKSTPLTQLELLEQGKAKKIPATDLLLQLGFFNEPYQRFLINTIFYGGYGTSEQVLKDLQGAQTINNVWAFSEYYSDSLEEKQLGKDNLKVSELRFIEIFLWWEKDVYIQNNV